MANAIVFIFLILFALMALWFVSRGWVSIGRTQAPLSPLVLPPSSPDIERLIRGLIEAIPHPVFLTDNERVILDANRAALYMVTLPRERVIGRVLATVIQDFETTQMMIAAAKSGVAQERTISRTANRETWHVTVQPLSLSTTPQESGKPSVISHILVFIDDETQLRYLEMVRKDFVASVSHELRTPLASVKLLAETLADTILDNPSASQNMAGRIIIEVDRLTELVDDLLELSRIESGSIRLELEPTDINGVLEVAAGRMRALASERNITITSALADDLPMVQADSSRIEQVLVNLIHNAIKFTLAGGNITLCAQVGSNAEAKAALMSRDAALAKTIEAAEVVMIVRVRDTGVGIAFEDLPRVFERFFKAKELPTRGAEFQSGVRKAKHSEGTGLGLAIARYIIEAHHGQLWAESQLGRGSTFSFTLPLASRGEAQAQAQKMGVSD